MHDKRSGCAAVAVAALQIAAQHMDGLPRSDLAAFAVHCMRAGLPEEAAMAASRAPEELTALVAVLQGTPDRVPPALEAAGMPQKQSVTYSVVTVLTNWHFCCLGPQGIQLCQFAAWTAGISKITMDSVCSPKSMMLGDILIPCVAN